MGVRSRDQRLLTMRNSFSKSSDIMAARSSAIPNLS